MTGSHSRTRIMGVINVTPDSFSDGGEFLESSHAIEHGLALVEQGADILDIGGESTRPGAGRIDAAAQCARVLPVIQGLRTRLDKNISISIDTTLAEVAAAAVAAGADMINDISAGRDDPEILALAARHDIPIVLMHMQGTPATMQKDPHYEDVVEEILGWLLARAAAAEAVGVAPGRILIDPGIGFGKTFEHNLTLLRHLPRFTGAGYRVLLGASRKRFLQMLCGTGPGAELAAATAAVTVAAVRAGVDIVRVHDVRENRQAADVAAALFTSAP